MGDNRDGQLDPHDISIESAFVVDGWWASCSCGWIGEKWEDADDAALDGSSHQVDVDAR